MTAHDKSHRLVRTEQLLGAVVTSVSVSDVYDERERLRQPPDDDRDYARVLTKLSRGLKSRTFSTYRTYVGAYWQLCVQRGGQLTDPDLFRGFLIAVSRHANRQPSASTLKVVCSSITALLQVLAMPSPVHDPATKHWLSVEMKTRASRKIKRSDAILVGEIDQAIISTQAMVVAGGQLRLRGLRDRALILLGWTAALRRSELVAVCRHHVRQTYIKTRWELIIPESKTGHGEDQIIPIVRASKKRYDAIAAVQAWMDAARIQPEDPLFRRILRDGSLGAERLHPGAVRDILRQHGMGDGYSPHSLRSGFVTQARLNGAETHQIRTVTRHASDVMVDVYTRQVDPRRQGPGALA